MKSDRFMRIGLAIVVALLLMNLLLRQQTTSQAAAHVQYNVVELPDKLRFRAKAQDLQSILDQQGSQGWELVIRFENDRGQYLIFKK